MKHNLNKTKRLEILYISGKGFYFIPEISEEVWVSFESINAEKPFVMERITMARKRAGITRQEMTKK
ncbi:hypothetical protein ASG22_15270 [Chryseobacterium sp. Leaf405]|uniref:phage baseplate assembly protein V n=1 Tax=Chryseobacterium sp. Leaf405 TaxID=1736367 RepID=UPI0006FF3455|nr:hypothetical protein ASG22_15270 [Chryseobacterium sp. Leaf405]